MAFTKSGRAHRLGRVAIIAALTTGVTLAATPAFAGSKEEWKFVAHRGGSVQTPEMTIAAFTHMLTIPGVEAVEFDIQFTKDGVPVVFHDNTVNRTTNCSGQVLSFSLAALKLCSAGYPSKFGTAFETERVPTVKEALEFISPQVDGNFQFFLHVKTESKSQAKQIAKLVANLDLEDQVIPISNSEVMLSYLKSEGLTKQGLVGGTNLFNKPTRYKFLIPYNVTLNSSVIKAAHQRGQKILPVQDHPYSLAKLDQFDIDGLLADNTQQTYEFINNIAPVAAAKSSQVNTDGPIKATGPQNF